MRWITACSGLAVLGLLAMGFTAGCPPEDLDDDTVSGDDDDDIGDDDDGDDDTASWSGNYEVVRICGSDGGDPGDPGPDIDAIDLRRDASVVGSATAIVANAVATSGNGHPDANAALGGQDAVYVSIGPPGSYLDLTFGSGGVMEEGDVITLWEITDGSGQDEIYKVLVSEDGTPGKWVDTETAVGAYVVGIHAPAYYMEGCEG